MLESCAQQLLLVSALALASAPTWAQSSTDKAKPGESIAGKAAAAKTAPAKTAVQPKRYEFTAGAATAQSVAPQTSTAAPAAITEKSGCHSSKGSDA